MSAKVKIEVKEEAIQKAVDKNAPTSLKSAGAYVRRVAMSSIPQRKNPELHSRPGKPPASHAGFKKTILFALTSDRRTVVVGPRYVKGGLTNIARIHEFGGSRRVPVIDVDHFKNGFRVGEEGPMRTDRLTKRDEIVRRSNVLDPRTHRKVVWIKLRTERQAEMASRLYPRIASLEAKKKTVKYPARPYMGPALTRSLPKLTSFWKRAVK